MGRFHRQDEFVFALSWKIDKVREIEEGVGGSKVGKDLPKACSGLRTNFGLGVRRIATDRPQLPGLK